MEMGMYIDVDDGVEVRGFVSRVKWSEVKWVSKVSKRLLNQESKNICMDIMYEYNVCMYDKNQKMKQR